MYSPGDIGAEKLLGNISLLPTSSVCFISQWNKHKDTHAHTRTHTHTHTHTWSLTVIQHISRNVLLSNLNTLMCCWFTLFMGRLYYAAIQSHFFSCLSCSVCSLACVIEYAPMRSIELIKCPCGQLCHPEALSQIAFTCSLLCLIASSGSNFVCSVIDFITELLKPEICMLFS